MEMEEFQEADVLWPWPDTPPPWPVSPAPELYDERDAAGFSCEPFSEPEAASLSSASTPFDRSSSGSSEDGFFLSGRSTVVSGFEASSEEFLEKDVLWPDTTADADQADGDAAEFWCRCCRRVEEVAAACGKRDGWRPRPLVSSPIDIPVRTRTRATAALRRPSPSAVPLHRRW